MKIIKGEYIKVISKLRFKSRIGFEKELSKSKTLKRGVIPFSNKVLTTFAF